MTTTPHQEEPASTPNSPDLALYAGRILGRPDMDLDASLREVLQAAADFGLDEEAQVSFACIINDAFGTVAPWPVLYHTITALREDHR